MGIMRQDRVSRSYPVRGYDRRDSGQTRRVPRTREIYRISATLDKAAVAREIMLEWLENDAKTELPDAAFDGKAFHHETDNGRTFSAVRAKEDQSDMWGLRYIEPETGEIERQWTTEIVLREREGKEAEFSLRKLAKSSESRMRVSPVAPPFLEHVAKECAMEQGAAKLEKDPWVVESEFDAANLAEYLVDHERHTPALVLTVPEDAEDPNEPLLDPVSLAAETLGLAKVIVLPAEYTWKLTNRFGKRLSVYRGAMRVYLAGFSERANPEGGHDLFMPHRMETPESASKLVSLLHWISARESLRRLRLGREIQPFLSALLPSIKLEAAKLQAAGGSAKDQFEAATRHTAVLGAELMQALQIQQSLTVELQISEARVREAEFRLRRSSRPRPPVGRGPRPQYDDRRRGGYDSRGPRYGDRGGRYREGRRRPFEDRGRGGYGDRFRRPFNRGRGRMDEAGRGAPREGRDNAGRGAPRGRMDEAGRGAPREGRDNAGRGAPRGRMDEAGRGAPRERRDDAGRGAPRRWDARDDDRGYNS